MDLRRKLGMLCASLVLVLGSMLMALAPASAAIVPNNMLCEPDTGWCYQVNPPYNPSVPHYCQWDYRLHGLRSGMWYTGCNLWGSAIH